MTSTSPPGPREISHYRIVSTLGSGGMGDVYLAEDTRLARLVAIKLLRADLTRDLARLRRFEQEARAVSALNHPNIVTIYEIGESDASRFIALEYVKGQTLRAFVGGSQGVDAVAPIGRQVATALGVAHSAGIVHRDIKPENVMVRDDGYVKVLDFGLARLGVGDPSSDSTADTALHTRPGMLVGTVAYMSPEQIKGGSVGTASDVFSLGVVLYEMVTGRKPFKGGSEVAWMYQIVHDHPEPPIGVNPAVPPPISALIVAMLDKDPQRRPAAPDVAMALIGGDSIMVPVVIKPPVATGPTRKTVGRIAERARLHAAADSAAAGTGVMMCVTGEAGIGKTTLVEDFLTELQSARPTWAIARGRCSERLAGAEAYLPMLEALDSLIQSSPALGRAMKAAAPSWYVQVAPSIEASVERLLTESPAVSQERMKRELAAFLRETSQSNPIVLFVDDLHWADASTIDMLAYIGTKLASTHLLIVATYRPAEMQLTRHPFLPVALDLQARGVANELPLGFLTREDVDQYLALEFQGHSFPPAFASLIHAKTEGSPLFMADVVRYLRDRHVIGIDQGRWALVQTVPEIETDLPETVRSMIQRKIAQIDDADRRLLVTASVQGYAFDSAVVGRALGMEAGEVEERLQALDRAHGFVGFVHEDELPDHTLTLRYRFVHLLYQNALYATLTPSRRASASAAVGKALLGFYAKDTAPIALELAFLFRAARDWPAASEYFLQAARGAARIFANQEAISLCRLGLEMNRRAAEGPERVRQELRLHMTLGPSLMTVKGFSARDTLHAYLRARDLSDRLGDATQQFRSLFGLSIVSVVRAEYGKAREFAERCLELADNSGDTALLVQAHWALGLSLQYIGDFPSARIHLERSVSLYDPERHAAHVFLYGAILNRAHLGRTLLFLGYPDQADALVRDAIRVAERLRHPLALCNALSVAVTVDAFHGRRSEVLAMTETMKFHADEHGLPYYAGIATIMQGWARAIDGDVDAGTNDMRAGLVAHRLVETEQQRPYYLALLAEASCAGGRPDDGLQAIDQAVEGIERRGERFYAAEVHRIRAELLMQKGDREEAERAARQAIAIARSQQAKTIELRAAMSLVRFNREDDRSAEALATLADVCGWFTEGLETPDLKAARGLLGEHHGAGR